MPRPGASLLAFALVALAAYPHAAAQDVATDLTLACFDVTGVSQWVVSVNASCSVTGAQSHRWTWGDGTSTTTTYATASHAYNVRGTYTICLTASYALTSDTVCKTTPRVGPTDQVLAEHWAPVFYQDTDTTDASADEIAAFNFDGNWKGADNWDNEPAYSHRAYVYYYVMETTAHYYLGYMAFHPRDWAEGSGREHENDMEGALLMIRKTSSPYGSFVAAHTMAHWEFHPYVTSGSGVAAKSTHPHGPAQTLTFWGTHVELGIEAHGHGMYRKQAVYGTDFDGHGIVYYPATYGEIPSGSNDRDVKYGLLTIDPLWDRRYDYGAGNPYQSYGIFDGDESGTCGDALLIPCDTDKARPPWGMYDAAEPTATVGIWWTNPAQYYKDHMDGLGTVPTTYVHKSYA